MRNAARVLALAVLTALVLSPCFIAAVRGDPPDLYRYVIPGVQSSQSRETIVVLVASGSAGQSLPVTIKYIRLEGTAPATGTVGVPGGPTEVGVVRKIVKEFSGGHETQYWNISEDVGPFSGCIVVEAREPVAGFGLLTPRKVGLWLWSGSDLVLPLQPVR